MKKTGNVGRGNKAPYETQHYRIPLPLKPMIEEIAHHFRELVSDNQKYSNSVAISIALQRAVGPLRDCEQFQEAKKILTAAMKMPGNKGGELKTAIKAALQNLEDISND